MPPSSTRKGRARKVAEPGERADSDAPASGHATPSRKRRRVNDTDGADSPNGIDAGLPPAGGGARATKKTQRNGDIQVFEDEHSFNEEEPEINVVIRGLRTASYDVQARVDFSNEVQEAEHPEGKAAYAKIAGHGWTFYVEDLEVRIGRPPEARDSQGPESRTPQSTDDKSLVHIDLGPSKHVSRQHAEIRYDSADNAWNIHVLGRNGIKLDERPVRRGETATLHCGSVIDIADTQMIFVTPNVEPEIHPAIRAQTRAALDEDDDDDDGDVRPPGVPTATHTPTRAPAERSTTNHQSTTMNGQSGTHKRAAGADGAQNGPADASFPSSVSKGGGKTSPIYSRAMLLEADDVDFAQDSAKDLKPPHSYAQLIGMAILSSPEEKLTLSKIYEWIKERYAFYRLNGGGWQNSIRHNLSLNKCFEKIARRTDEPGKGMKWQIVPEHRDDFIKKGLSAPRRAIARGSSIPNSPVKEARTPDAHEKHADKAFPRDEPDSGKRIMYKTSPGSTPPVAHYPVMKQSFTPERGGAKFYTEQEGSSPRARGGYQGGVSPFPLRGIKREGFTDAAAAAGSPGGPTMLLGSDPDTSLITPLISRHAPKLAPPSTARLPSQYMAFSSPAPFWKYADFGSTPAKPQLGTSPVKFEPPQKTERDEEKLSLKGSIKDGIRSASPSLPEAEIGHESPTKGRGLDRLGTGHAKSHSRAGSQPRQPSPVKQAAPSHKMATPPADMDDDDDDDENEGVGMIDLARGFQPIGSFHRNMSAGAIGGP